ncbi:NUDIX domain-containing protein [Rhodospirillaceae bacterium KN72]|uniref:NUDIX domain-containing protein n=1 Tax=Pacificispira spongiicola TaxID=2729598 RepID=A0A7Y0HH30_9PROT|nr:NUDIX domain-containing protein [Pacificispira spongiicola]NMM46283.1 NUDIX domain-containing protein [Pacificispira spongiicola]
MDTVRNFPITGILKPADATAVIIWTPDGRYLMQVRDDIPGIFYPGHYGLFGGAREDGETFEECAIREVREELDLDIRGHLRPFTSCMLGFEPFGYGRVERVFFDCCLPEDALTGLVLTEGQRYELIDGETLLSMKRVTPYDAFALWQHINVRNSPAR